MHLQQRTKPSLFSSPSSLLSPPSLTSTSSLMLTPSPSSSSSSSSSSLSSSSSPSPSPSPSPSRSPFPSSTTTTTTTSSSSSLFVLAYPPSAYHPPCSVLPRTTVEKSTRCSSTFLSSSSSPSSSSPSTSCPTLLSVFAWSVMLLLMSSCIGPTDGGILNGHPLGKRSFIDIQCKGIYDKSLFARLDRICEDCYNLFREPQLHQLCRKNCFTSDYFKGCLDVLLLQDDVAKIQTWIKKLHGAEPGV